MRLLDVQCTLYMCRSSGGDDIIGMLGVDHLPNYEVDWSVQPAIEGKLWSIELSNGNQFNFLKTMKSKAYLGLDVSA